MPNLKEEELVERIKKFKVFSELSEEHLHDIVANSSLCTYNKKFSLYSKKLSSRIDCRIFFTKLTIKYKL